MQNQTEITGVKRVRNGALQAVMTDTVISGQVNALGLLNKGDERFSVGSIQNLWPKVTIDGLKQIKDKNGRPISKADLDAIEKLDEGEQHNFAMPVINPMIEGMRLRFLIQETTVPANDWERQNVDRAAKQIVLDASRVGNLPSEFDLTEYSGQPGYFVTENGDPIFAHKSIVLVADGEEPKHRKIGNYLVVPGVEFDAYVKDYELAAPTTVKETVKK